MHPLHARMEWRWLSHYLLKFMHKSKRNSWLLGVVFSNAGFSHFLFTFFSLVMDIVNSFILRFAHPYAFLLYVDDVDVVETMPPHSVIETRTHNAD